MSITDPAWIEAADILERFRHHRRLYGPQEFMPFADGLLPLEYSEAYDDGTFFVCSKDDADLLSSRIRNNLGDWTCVFANDVLVAYSALPQDCVHSAPVTMLQHLPYFLDKLAAVREGSQTRQSRLNPLFPVGDFSPQHRGRRVLVVNAGNMGNFGDELLATATVKFCRDAMLDAEIIVSEPEIDRSLIARADHIVFGGGGILYDFADQFEPEARVDLRNLANYFKFGYYARQSAATFTVLGLGHQQPRAHLFTDAGRHYMRGALRDATAVTTRDRDTAALIEREFLGQECGSLYALEDMSFSILDAKAPGQREIRHITFIGRPWPTIFAMIDMLHRREIALRLVIQANEDVVLPERVRAQLPEVKFETLDIRRMPVTEGVAAFQATDAVVTARFHSYAMALTAGLPIIALDHEGGKKERLARRTVGNDWRRLIIRPTDTEEVALAHLEELLSGTLPRCKPQTVQSLIDRARDNGPILHRALGPVGPL